MILFLLLITNLWSAELSTLKIEGKLVIADNNKFCLRNDNSKICVKMKPSYERYTKPKDANEKVTIVIDAEDLIQEVQK